MVRFTSILERLGGGNSNVVSRLVEGRKVPMGSGLFNPVEVVVERLKSPEAHKDRGTKKKRKHKRNIRKRNP